MIQRKVIFVILQQQTGIPIVRDSLGANGLSRPAVSQYL